MAELEYCCKCDQPTGRAGQGDDSLYTKDVGPYCWECFPEKEKPMDEEAARGKAYAQGRHDMRLHCASLALKPARWSCLNPNDKRVATEAYAKGQANYAAAILKEE